MDRPSSLARRFRLLVALLAAAAACGAWGYAQIPGALAFTDTLLQSEKAAIGLEKLSPAEVDNLNLQIDRELTLARQGNVKGFATPFTQRRQPPQLLSSGLSRLAEAERRALDDAIARTMAVPTVLSLPPKFTRTNPVETVAPRSRIHGEFSFTYGWTSGGGSLYGGSMTMIYQDPNRPLTAAIRYSTYRGDGLYGYGPYENVDVNLSYGPVSAMISHDPLGLDLPWGGYPGSRYRYAPLQPGYGVRR